jgi:lipopolysaccharide export system permease protein
MPQALYRMFPLLAILATIAMFLGLARTSELVVTRAAGRSALRALIAPVAVAALIGAAGVAVLNPIVAATLARYEARAAAISSDGGSALSISAEGLWLRQGGASGQTVIRAERANADGTVLHGVTFLEFAPPGADGRRGPLRRIEAASAALAPGAWQLRDAKVWPLDRPNPEADATRHQRLSISTTLTRDQIRDSFGTPASVPIWDLPRYIDDLSQAGFSARLHRVWFQMELALPLFLAGMVMIGAGFTMRHTRFGRTGQMVMLALLMGFSIYFIRNFAQILGENGQIPVALAAWSPPVAAILLSLGLLLHLEDG